MKLTKEQIQEIRELRNKDLTQMQIAQQLGISQKTVSYWLQDEEKRKEVIQLVCQRFRNKSKEQRQEVYKRRRDYLREYHRKRYQEDEEFRKKKIESARKRYEIKNDRNNKRKNNNDNK